MELFDAKPKQSAKSQAPLADRMRPKNLDEFVGQEHLAADGKFLKNLIEKKEIPSRILWGPPGTGKTTLANIIAEAAGSRFVSFSAVLSGVKEIRDVIKDAKDEFAYRKIKTILFPVSFANLPNQKVFYLLVNPPEYLYRCFFLPLHAPQNQIKRNGLPLLFSKLAELSF